MEKYGVEQQRPAAKQASAAHSCPTCGQAVTKRGQSLYCRNFGTKPWEEPRAVKEDPPEQKAQDL